MTNKTKTRVFYSSALFSLILVLGSARLSRYLIIHDHSITTCVVDDVRSVGRTQETVIKYHFTVSGKQYKSDMSFNNGIMSAGNFNRLEGRNLPVAYLRKCGIVISYLLILPKDFDTFQIHYPDSLKWVLPLLNK